MALHPDLTSLLEGDTLRRREIHIGFALGTDDGLFLPVVRKTDKLSLEEIATITGQYALKSKKKQITEEDLTGGTFTVSNLGMFGVESFTAIIVPSQAAILSVGAVTDQPRREENGGLAWHAVMSATLTLDHRIADGVAAAKFLQDLQGAAQHSLTQKSCSSLPPKNAALSRSTPKFVAPAKHLPYDGPAPGGTVPHGLFGGGFANETT